MKFKRLLRQLISLDGENEENYEDADADFEDEFDKCYGQTNHLSQYLVLTPHEEISFKFSCLYTKITNVTVVGFNKF